MKSKTIMEKESKRGFGKEESQKQMAQGSVQREKTNEKKLFPFFFNN